ncbi:WbqC family protein [Tenacibaculum sp. SG-28]|uniref:WbqC family protein n=1 Tax=Tenacibaculum sp. SG-28 TaxID=754426 RepID=UPI000CF3D41C|nr:WbqC family protein [Tenacibaculum sp. SG-28]PQJ23542.1 hypothetical protein BSU00_01955 [Tenacibaculum sp. SG-28]
MALFIPLYFAPVLQYTAIIKSDVVFEMQDNFQKQTYRNRCYIYGANGKLSLIVPVKSKFSETRKKTKDMLVENNFPWQQQHFKSIKSAYRSSPFFEYYEDDLAQIFEKKYTYLHDVNIDTHLFIADALQIDENYTTTKTYQTKITKEDFRELSVAKSGKQYPMESYVQMFDDKYGFLPNLSVLDLLFMEGPNSISILEKNSLDLI